MEKLMKFLRTGMGTAILVIVVIAGLGGAVWAFWSFVKGDTPDSGHYTMFIDSETGRAFKHKNAIGESVPIKSPQGHDAYPAEACYWTADGGVKKDPTYVLLNQWLGRKEPTYCPDCGRLVVGHNPNPNAVSGLRPPRKEND